MLVQVCKVVEVVMRYLPHDNLKVVSQCQEIGQVVFRDLVHQRRTLIGSAAAAAAAVNRLGL